MRRSLGYAPPLPGLSSRAENFDLFFCLDFDRFFDRIFSEIAKGQKEEIQAQHHIKSLEDEDEARGKEGETRRLAPDV